MLLLLQTCPDITMQRVVSLLALALFAVSYVEGGTKLTCKVENGNTLVGFSGKQKSIDMPCKYNAVSQKCGQYRIRLSPDYMFVYPRYIVESAWIAVETEDGDIWEGRTSNKLAGKYIIRQDEPARRPVVKNDRSTMETDALFTFHPGKKSITIREANNTFEIKFGPYDFAGKKHQDSFLSFTCLAGSAQIEPYPTQFCGLQEGSGLKDRTIELFQYSRKDDLTIMFDIFNNTSPVVQSEANCQSAVESLTTVCRTDAQRKEAISVCHLILANRGHTTCIAKHTCDPMDTYASCLKFACSDYKDKEACDVVGQGIDLCRNIEDLTPKIKGCYNDLITAEDNPYFGKNRITVE